MDIRNRTTMESCHLKIQDFSIIGTKECKNPSTFIIYCPSVKQQNLIEDVSKF